MVAAATASTGGNKPLGGGGGNGKIRIFEFSKLPQIAKKNGKFHANNEIPYLDTYKSKFRSKQSIFHRITLIFGLKCTFWLSESEGCYAQKRNLFAKLVKML